MFLDKFNERLRITPIQTEFAPEISAQRRQGAKKIAFAPWRLCVNIFLRTSKKRRLQRSLHINIGIIVIYFNSGFVDVSADGIGNRSICPGFGSGMMDGKYPFFLHLRISILATSSAANSTARSCITAFIASFFELSATAGIFTLGRARTILI